MSCFFGKGAAHPSTGCQWSERVLACRRCTVEFWKWFRARQHQRWGKQNFYEAAVKFKK